jgi:hypothetical protein
MRRSVILSALFFGTVAIAGAPRPAAAFCGFYINGAGSEMFNDATQVVMMRKGTRTVLSMQNDYKGPAESFAMVIPVPSVLKEADVKILPKDVFQRVDTMGAPRLVEYWEQDPCGREEYSKRRMSRPRMAMKASGASTMDEADDLGVTIEAKFVVGEYQIVILSAKDSTGLDTWLRREKFQIPKGAEPFLRPYVEAGMKFFVAKVDPKKVKFEDGRVALSPLRFHYDSEDFNLPIRLGLANSSGTQDLIVSILAPDQRYEVANYKNVTIPTNLDVKDSVRTRFGEFYASLFDRTVRRTPGAVVTEYAWQASTCDPCPGPQLGGNDFTLLGADVLEGTADKPTAYGNFDFVLTRLHARYGKDIKDDLVFKTADPIVGGREMRTDKGRLEKRATKSSVNNFQARYAIRHWWTGKIACKNPVRGRWGGPPNGRQPRPSPALQLAFAPRGKVKLPSLLISDVPEIGVKAYRKRKPTTSTGTGSGSAKPAAGSGSASTTRSSPSAPISDRTGWLVAGLGFAASLALLRRRRRG